MKITTGSYSGKSPELIDATMGRVELVNILSKLTSPKTDDELETRHVVEQYICDNPIKKSVRLGSVGQEVEVKALLQSAEWKVSHKQGTKTIKHEFIGGDGEKIIVYSTSKAIQSVQIGDTVTLKGQISKVLDFYYRGEQEQATILRKVFIIF